MRVVTCKSSSSPGYAFARQLPSCPPNFRGSMAPLLSVSGSENAGKCTIWKAHAALVLVQLGFAGGFVCSKLALTTGVNLIVFAVYRDVFALCALAPLAYFAEKGQRPRLDLTTIALLALLGLLGVFAAQLLVLFGLKLATASLGSVVTITVPVCVFLFSAVFGLEDINWRGWDGQAKAGGVASAVVGGVLTALYKGPAILGTVSPDSHSVVPGAELPFDEHGISPFAALDVGIENWQIGVILLFLTGLSVAIYISLQVPVLRRYPAPISLCAFAYVTGVLSFGALGLVTVSDWSHWVIREPAPIISALYVGVVATGTNYALQAWAVQRVGPVTVASYNPLTPLVTSALALIFLGESLHLGSVLGFLLIINGLCFITWGKIASQRLAGRAAEAAVTPDGLLVAVKDVKDDSNLREPLLA